MGPTGGWRLGTKAHHWRGGAVLQILTPGLTGQALLLLALHPGAHQCLPL
jgi:hypothetical protein